MAHNQIIRDRANTKHIGNTMRQNKSSAYPKSSISKFISVLDPWPTSIEFSLINMIPETLFQREFSISHTMPIDIVHGFAFDNSIFTIVLRGYLGFLSATTLAVAMDNFLRGIYYGIIVQVSLLLRLAMQSGVPAPRLQLIISRYIV
jgi:hypothetical protein